MFHLHYSGPPLYPGTENLPLHPTRAQLYPGTEKILLQPDPEQRWRDGAEHGDGDKLAKILEESEDGTERSCSGSDVFNSMDSYQSMTESSEEFDSEGSVASQLETRLQTIQVIERLETV